MTATSTEGTSRRPKVAVLDYGSGNVHSAVRMLERVGAEVSLTRDAALVGAADGLFVPGVGNFHACVAGLRAADGERLILDRLAVKAPVFGVCVGMQVLFDGSAEPSTDPQDGLGLWQGRVERLQAPVVPHMGWTQVNPPAGSALFHGVERERFYFVHSFAAPSQSPVSPTAVVTYATHGTSFVAAVEDGPLTATQFHPEKSGDAGARLLSNWLRTL